MWLFGYLKEVKRAVIIEMEKVQRVQRLVCGYKKTIRFVRQQRTNPDSLHPQPKRETIILKAHSEKPEMQGETALSKWDDTPATIKMRDNLEIINENMLRHWYDLYIADETYDLLLKELPETKPQQNRRRN